MRWLPTLQQQLSCFSKHGVLMDWRVYAHTCQTYYDQYTFEVCSTMQVEPHLINGAHYFLTTTASGFNGR